MTVGGGFPVVTPQGEQLWWIIPEGFVGQLISGFSTTGPALHVYTVTESTTKPPNAAAGPFSTQLQAQAKANQLNTTSGAATLPNIATAAAGSNPVSAIGDFFNRLTQPATWIRVGEFIGGTILIIVALNAMTKGPVRSATASTVKTGARVARKVAK